MIVQALADAALAKGYAVASGERGALVVVEVDDQRYGVRIAEATGKRWTLRLVLEIDGAGERLSRWVDYAQRRIEDDLPEVPTEMERRAAAVPRTKQPQVGNLRRPPPRGQLVWLKTMKDQAPARGTYALDFEALRS